MPLAGPATFGRLCVETIQHIKLRTADFPAAFGRLCVETITPFFIISFTCPAAFGRLCVETNLPNITKFSVTPAAFGRLCVETVTHTRGIAPMAQPPSGGCVLKPFWFPFVSCSDSSRLRAAVC